MEESDQDIDIAGTEADPEFEQRHRGQRPGEPDSTAEATDTAPPEHTPTARGSEPETLHRAEDDEAARSRSPEFHDLPGSGKHKTT